MKKYIYKVIFILSLLMFVFAFTSCTTVSGYSPGTSNPISQDYEVIGKVEKEFTSSVLFGVISWGDNKLDALKQLVAESNADDIINVSVEERDSYYLGALYFEKKFLLRGTAIKYTK